MRSSLASRAARVAGVVLLGTALAGCPGRGPTQTDRDRAELLRTDPVFADALEPPDMYLGWDLNDVSWRRSDAIAALASWRSPVPGGISEAEVDERIAEVLATIRNSGWTVLYTRCEVDSDGWRRDAVGYKVTAGVGIWFDLDTEIWPDGRGTSSVLLRAPGRRDPANLFADAPAGLAVGQTCIERPGASGPIEEDGVYLELAPSYDVDVTPDPSHR